MLKERSNYSSVNICYGNCSFIVNNKESILSAYIQSSIADFSQEMELFLKDQRGIEARLRLLLDFRHDLFGKDPELMTIYLSFRMQSLFNTELIHPKSPASPFDRPERSGLENLILKILTEAQKNQEIRSDIPVSVLARSFQLITVNYLFSCQYSQESLELEQLREQLIETFLNGAKPY